VRHVIDLARRDLQEDLRSPWTWILLGLFTFLAGWVYVTSLGSFIDQSAEAAMHPGRAINVNDLLIRPFLLNLAIVVSFVLPLITIRARSWYEKGVGSLSHPILGKRLPTPFSAVLCVDDDRRANPFAITTAMFVRAMALYAVMLLLTLVSVAALSLYGRLEWRWIAGGYLGLLLMGAALVAVGLFLASVARNAFVAAIPTFGLSLLVWTVKRVIAVSPVRAGSMLRDFSFADRFDDFAKGVVDSGHVVYFLSVALFGLLLTAKAIQADARATEAGSIDDGAHAG
jgi:ABC-2 type transport system permease protein